MKQVHRAKKLSVVLRIQFVLAILVTISVALSFSGNNGLNNMTREFDVLSNQAVPVSLKNATIVTSALEVEQSLSDMLMSDNEQSLNQTFAIYKNMHSQGEDAGKELELLATNYKINWLKQYAEKYLSEVESINQLAFDIYSIQKEIILNKEKLSTERSTMNYAISSVRSEMSRVGITLYSDNEYAMSNVTNFLNHAVELSGNLMLLVTEPDLVKARLIAKDLKRTNLSGMKYAWGELVRENAAINDFSSLTVPFEMVKKLFAEQGYIERYLNVLKLDEEQSIKYTEVKHQTSLIMDLLQVITQQSHGLIKNGENGFTHASNDARQMFLIFSIIGLIISVLAGSWISRVVRKSIEHISDVVNKISEGNLTVKANTNAASEFAQLAEVLNDLCDHDRESLQQLITNSNELTSAAELSMRASTTSRVALQNQSEELAVVTTSMTQLEGSIREISQSSSESEKQAQKAQQLALNGVGIIECSTQGLLALEEQFAINEKRMQELDNYVKEITEVVELISSIANNTNLLALNAAIEAARAGEQGRGFAVVADEVRQLASETNQQTESIRNTIASLHKAADDVNEAMLVSRKEMMSSIERSSDVQQAINLIKNTISDINQKMVTIAVATQQQERASQHVAQNLEQVASRAQQNNHQLDTLVDEAERVAVIAQQQQGMLSRYHLEDENDAVLSFETPVSTN
ncbi:methyl-accepting chemotaxis protein [Photobacterium angustum]|uniref:Methyl-accepting chemotaxis protein n=1 Tax=Photobacterium angustum TaxID=661 RepID=A0A855S9X3_PHOAN|nr:methyl-accepting chemotaxis protein [Photobacterium angustum]KJG30082.1 chemotaxis protein [Photobacterium angustum]KJG48498.1 chemotaxis protein [Photobacterium angustum]PSW88977.1 methyl-accepting chemotaxis protein [Photobacterium angustum]PSX06327.1 methyl-accepting chemotaxis protein [Photobacterium angustum]PSX13797.1 methyl-accepting chemotaxis protein [Photobacterium angustum]